MKNSLSKAVTLSCVIINALTATSVVLLRNNLPPIVPLFYGLPVSDQLLTQSINLTFPPLIATILGILNLKIGNLTKDQFLEKILVSLNVTITALSTITVLRIIFLVGKI